MKRLNVINNKHNIKSKKETGFTVLMGGMGVILMVAIAFGFAACSSLPKDVPNRSQTFAGIKMSLARDMQKKQDYDNALRLYKDAYDYFTRVDDIRGKISAGLSVGRQYYYLDKPEEAGKWIKIAEGLIDAHYPRMGAEKIILLIEMAFGKKDYAKVVQIAASAGTSSDSIVQSLKGIENIEFQAEILCYVMVSKAFLNEKLDYKAELMELRSLLKKLQEKFDKKGLDDPETLSVGYYYIGYIYGNMERNWKDAMIFFEKARSVDSQIDNAYGLGKDLFSLGQCYEALGIINEAKSSYERAREIFVLLKNNDMIEKISKELESPGK